jgi:AcrR family transcriptional regulator
MIKQTFYNLPPAKKERIINAIKNEFDRVPINKVSINSIIQEAKISRGSFYQYFDDKDDLFEIIAIEINDSIKDIFIEYLLKNKGDIFDTFKDFHNSMLNNYDEHSIKKHFDKFMPINSLNAKSIFDKLDAGMDKNKDLFIRNINTSKLTVKSIPQLDALFDMMLMILRTSFKEFVIDKKPAEAVTEEFNTKMNILRQGCIK